MGLIKAIARKKRYLLVALAIVLVGWGAYYLWVSRGAGKAAGIYMTGDGSGYVVIERSWIPGRLRVSEGMLYFYPNLARPDKKPKIKISFRNGQLHLFQRYFFQASRRSYSKLKSSNDLKLILYSSGESGLDWAVYDASIELILPQIFQTRLFSRSYWKDITSSISWPDFKNRMAHYHKDVYLLPLRLDHDPMPYFLHRLDDPRVADYMRNRLKRPSTPDDLSLMRQIAADHPDDPWLMMHLIELEADHGDLGKARAYVNQWFTIQGAQGDVLMWEAYEKAYKHLLYALVQRDYPDLENIKDIYALPSPQLSLLEQLDWFRKLSHLDGILLEPQPLVKDIYNPLYDPVYAKPNYMAIHKCAKFAGTVSMFDLFLGRRQDALNLLSGLYRLGQSMSADGVYDCRRHGRAFRRISGDGLGILVMNACETPEEIRVVRQRLDWLDRIPIKAKPESLYSENEPGLLHQVDHNSFEYHPNYQETMTRVRVVDALWENVLMGAAIKEYFLMTGEFPQSNDQIEMLFEKRIPSDPFDDKDSPIRFITTSDDCVVYSIGPDKADDFTKIEYDPSNGTFSQGDILIRATREREYPFSREGVYAATAADLQRQFPNGLPADPFRPPGHKYPLSVADSDGNHPVRIYSYGPDEKDNKAQMELDPFSRYSGNYDLIYNVPKK